ncbi:hypothetical protein BDV95DRAFT_574253 [Massariosphaeria phaeospora]|uniref:Uncharacterized protein n=1 Tax=Massariosphaeria phaeospora TaxID=100035 RepID=A0A7C8M8H5_9PLEO|nr:hypothetical protein BDV95DRAFT_574253 [Massariosphaeria phaeospora]
MHTTFAMARLPILALSLVSYILLFITTLSIASEVPEVELLPLNKHGKRSSFRKRMEDPEEGLGGLDLQNTGIFLWGVGASSTLMMANLTLDFAREHEAIIDMDDFAGLVKSIDCTAPDLSLDFKDEKSYAYAKEAWNWVNSDANYTFLLVASAEACEPDSRRQPFLVTDLDFDEANNKVLMRAEQKLWEDVAESYSFKITNEPLPLDGPVRAKRDGSTLNLKHDFSRRLFDINSKGLDIGVSCSKCGTEGSVLVDFDIEKKWKVPAGASMQITPQNVAASIELALHLSGKLTSAYSPGDVNVVSVPITGINVGDVFKIGVFLTVDLGFEIDEWSGSAQASMGARMAIPNSSNLKINLFGKGDHAMSGWVPQFSKIPPSLSAKVEGSAEAYAQAGVEISAKGLKQGFTVGLDMKMPYIRADFSAMANSKGVCGTKKTLGVDVQADIGAELLASAAKGDDPPFWSYTLFDKTLGTLIDKCYPFGPENAATGGGGDPAPPRKTKKPKSKTRKASKKPTHPKTSAPAKTAKPITAKSKKPRPTNPKSTKTTKPKATTPPKTTDNPKPSDRSSHGPSASRKPTEVDKSSRTPTASPKSTNKPVSKSSSTLAEGSITTSNSGSSKPVSTSVDSTRSSSIVLSNTTSTRKVGTPNTIRTLSNDPPSDTSVASSLQSSVISSLLSASPSSTSSTLDRCGSATGTQGAAACQKTTPCEVSDPEQVDSEEILSRVKRSGYANSRSMKIEKRARKKGKPCSGAYAQFELESDPYPVNGELDSSVPAYGWLPQNNVCEYRWQSGTKRDSSPTSSYDSEHVMEWQLVTDFFTKMNLKGGLKYQHPDPKEGDDSKVDFCTYWIESWSLPETDTFTLPGSSAKLDPWQHLRAAYPSTRNHREEMIALQKAVNNGPKARMFSDKDPIWNEDKMKKLAESDQEADWNKVLARLRLALGAQKYLTEPNVITIFKDQTSRMGIVLDELDNAMTSHPRKEGTTEYHPWKPQNLLVEWNMFLDEKWIKATEKHELFMTTWIQKLNDAHCQSKGAKSTINVEFCERWGKLDAEYGKVSAFSKPF